MFAVSRLMERIYTGEQARPLRHRLVQATTGTFGIRVLSTGLSFLISMLLARLLGAMGYGAYSYVMAWIALLAIPSLFGLDRLLIREVAVYRTRSEWNLLRGLLHWSDRMALISSLGLGSVIAGLSWIFAEPLGLQIGTELWLGLLLLPFVTLVDLRQGALQGLNHVVMSLLPDFLIRPVALLAFLVSASLFLGHRLTEHSALGFTIAATAVTFLVGTYMLRTVLPLYAKQALPAYQAKEWIRSALSMVVINGMNVINHRAGAIMLGTLRGTELVGIYVVAERGAGLIALIQTAAHMALAPTISSLHAKAKTERLQSVITKSVRLVSLISVAIAVGLLVFSEWFLLLFGAEFIQAYRSLVILAVGYVVNTASGAAGVLLVMTGRERDAALTVGVGVALYLILSAAFIPDWGVDGAATAMSVSMIVRNLLAARLAYNRLGIQCTVFGRTGVKQKPR
jgi:O-antigen/teichoic acid export membrane protein